MTSANKPLMTKGNCLAVIRKSLGVHTDDYMGDMNQNY